MAAEYSIAKIDIFRSEWRYSAAVQVLDLSSNQLLPQRIWRDIAPIQGSRDPTKFATVDLGACIVNDDTRWGVVSSRLPEGSTYHDDQVPVWLAPIDSVADSRDPFLSRLDRALALLCTLCSRRRR